jgi:hypothetical protein
MKDWSFRNGKEVLLPMVCVPSDWHNPIWPSSIKRTLLRRSCRSTRCTDKSER